MKFSYKLISKPLLALFAIYAVSMDIRDKSTFDAMIMTAIAISYVIGTYKTYSRSLTKDK